MSPPTRPRPRASRCQRPRAGRRRGRLSGHPPPRPFMAFGPICTPPPGGWILPTVKATHKEAATRRLQTAVGHLQAVLRMVDDDVYCPEIMKQLSAVQGSLEGVNRIVLR